MNITSFPFTRKFQPRGCNAKGKHSQRHKFHGVLDEGPAKIPCSGEGNSHMSSSNPDGAPAVCEVLCLLLSGGQSKGGKGLNSDWG